MAYKISVIIPVYNVEKYIERCAKSLFGQTFSSIEYIFVNDCTSDNSLELLKRVVLSYPNRAKDIVYISHDSNKGLPTARNSGLSIARGEYLFHFDSDDWADREMFEMMYLAAQKNEADIVYTDWYLSYQKKERYMSQPHFNTSEDCLRGILCGRMKYNVWNKLIRKDLYSKYQICFPDGLGMGEDMAMIKFFCHSAKIFHLKEAFYHYGQVNTNAYTKIVSDQYLDQIYFNANKTIDYIHTVLGTKALEKEIHLFRLTVKLPLLISSQKEMYEVWLKWFPDSNEYIKQNNAFPFRIRCIQYAAIKRQYWFIQLYYYVFVKFVYGIIYR
ncbi:glycosyltransferase family 2 protein [uncultured Bacteroides sp.]|uniref:glycosyltransferase family 2 protein n=1 Tax=uncultured Bacteroides sp. TaxID=162156 RepID=UPI002AABA007|nr:glycosyltransferase family 2 protein [uncultured Bacteroides sp.]